MADIQDVLVADLRPGMTVDMTETALRFDGNVWETEYEFGTVEAVQVFPEVGVELHTSQGTYMLPESWTVPHIAYLDQE